MAMCVTDYEIFISLSEDCEEWNGTDVELLASEELLEMHWRHTLTPQASDRIVDELRNLKMVEEGLEQESVWQWAKRTLLRRR